MKGESDSVRIARTEEGIVRIHDKLKSSDEKADRNHTAVMGALAPLIKQTRDNSDDIIKIQQNHRWIYALAVFGPVSVAAVMEIVFRYGH